jgi:3-oxoadipate enol-lactonase
VLVGASVGSFIAVQFALDHAAMVSGLVLVGPTISGLMPSEHFITRGNRGQPPPQAPLEARIEYWTTKDPWILAPQNTAAREKMRVLLVANPSGPANGRQFARFPMQPALPRLLEIKVPTLIVSGEYDMPDVHAWGGAIQAGISESRRIVLAGSGHLPQFESPSTFNQELLKFLHSIK